MPKKMLRKNVKCLSASTSLGIVLIIREMETNLNDLDDPLTLYSSVFNF